MKISCHGGKGYCKVFEVSSYRQCGCLKIIMQNVELDMRLQYLVPHNIMLVVERVNKIIEEKVKNMFKMAKLPKSFQGEAIHNTCYLLNRYSLVPLNFHIPERVCNGPNISNSDLKVFDCKIFAHLVKD